MILEEQKQKGKMPEFNKLNKMKKISFLRATLLAATLVVAGYGGMKAYDYSYAKRVNCDDAMLMLNVEALSDEEGVSSYQYPEGYVKTYPCGANIMTSDTTSVPCSKTCITCPGGGLGCDPKPCPEHG